MFELSARLLYYKRRDVQEAMLRCAQDREVGVRYGDKGYGKRPDILMYGNDILNHAKNNATSFHISEERWNNPLELNTELKKHELNNLRKGWDLVLDIDCPYWKISKLTTYLFIRALELHNIKSISCKFSGNKGFHIGVPFEAFPKEINGEETRLWFPEGPKKIALYLISYLTNNLIDVKGEDIHFEDTVMTLSEISEITGKTKEELTMKICRNCKKNIKLKEQKNKFVCPSCQLNINENLSHKTCPKCNILMEKIEASDKICDCGSKEYKEAFDPLSIIELDTILISSRHMFRAPYSLHEKTGLSSVPINPKKIMSFEKKEAEPKNISFEFAFLDTSNTLSGEASELMINSLDYGRQNVKEEKKQNISFDEFTNKVPVELFPPCIKKILEGLEDGKKRSLFILTNFLKSVNWKNEEIETLILEWNTKNKGPLKEGYVISHLRYNKQRNEKILPPNCRSYYQDLRICFPDTLCDKIKNPVQYSKKKMRILNPKKAQRVRLTEEQKEMRKKHRESLKKAKTEEKENEDKEKGN